MGLFCAKPAFSGIYRPVDSEENLFRRASFSCQFVSNQHRIAATQVLSQVGPSMSFSVFSRGRSICATLMVPGMGLMLEACSLSVSSPPRAPMPRIRIRTRHRIRMGAGQIPRIQVRRRRRPAEDQLRPSEAPLPEKQKKANAKALKNRVEQDLPEMAGRRRPLDHH